VHLEGMFLKVSNFISSNSNPYSLDSPDIVWVIQKSVTAFLEPYPPRLAQMHQFTAGNAQSLLGFLAGKPFVGVCCVVCHGLLSIFRVSSYNRCW
jgi:hypothetical protein